MSAPSASLRRWELPAPSASLRRWELPALAAILLLATVLRVGWPRLTEFKFSEARLEALALEVTREGRLPLIGVPSSAGFDHSPLSVYLYVPAFLFSANPLPATVYGGLVGVAAVALCWWLARRWKGGGRWAALASALLLAVSPWAVAFSRKIWQVTFVPLLALGFVGLAVSALVGKRRWNLAWALLLYAVLVQVHPSALSLAPALALWLVVFWRRVRPAPLLVGGALGLLSAAPFLVHQVQSDWPVLAAFEALPGAVWDWTAARLAWEAITGRGIHALAGDAYPLLDVVPQLGWWFNLVGWLTAAAIAVVILRGERRLRVTKNLPHVGRGLRPSPLQEVDLILLTWLVVPVLFNLRHSLALHLHFFALVIPAACLLVGRAARALFAAPRPRSWRVVSLAALSLLAAAQVAALALVGCFVATHETPGGFGAPLGRSLELADRAVAAARKMGAAEVLVVAAGDSPVVDETPAIFDVLLRGRVAYRFVDGDAAALFPPQRTLALVVPGAGQAAAWYDGWPSEDLAGSYHGSGGYRLVALDGAWPQEGLEPVNGPRLFESGVEVQGYAWGQGRLWLLWQVLWLDPGDTHFAVRVVDGAGELLGQADGAGYPAAYRRKGDRVVSKFDIIFTGRQAQGEKWGRVGLYFYPQVLPAPLIDGAGNALGDAVVVGPLEEEH